MFWFFLGMLTGIGLYRAVNKQNKPDYSSIAYVQSQIVEHEMLANYYKRILLQEPNVVGTGNVDVNITSDHKKKS